MLIILDFLNFFSFWILILTYISNTTSNESSSLDHYVSQEDDPISNQRFQQIMQGPPESRWKEPKFKVDKADKVDVKSKLDNLNISYVYQPKWPDQTKTLGAVTAVTFDKSGNVVIFHRVDRKWTRKTFDIYNNYKEKDLGAIQNNTVIAYNKNTGKVVYEWGGNLFYMPHGLTIDNEDNVWITDVALHQVMKFGPRGSSNKPLMTLGTEFSPGKSYNKFCKPTSVAVLPEGDFFVADGYCNARIMKFSKKGYFLLQWGKNTFQGDAYKVAPKNFFAIPHALTLVNDKELICAADRENGRVQCFYTTNGTFYSQYHSEVIGDRIFSVDYTPAFGGQLFVVNGPIDKFDGRNNHYSEVRGFNIDMKTKVVLSKFGPNDVEFSNPHDIAVTKDGYEVYVAELDPYRIHKFINKRSVKSTSLSTSINSTLNNDINSSDNKNNNANNDDNNSSSIINNNIITIGKSKTSPNSTKLLIIILIIVLIIITFGLTLLISRKHKRGKLTTLTNTGDLEYSKLVSRSICDE